MRLVFETVVIRFVNIFCVCAFIALISLPKRDSFPRKWLAKRLPVYYFQAIFGVLKLAVYGEE